MNPNTKRVFIITFVFAVIIGAVAYFNWPFSQSQIISPLGNTIETIRSKPLDSYTFENLAQTQYEEKQIQIEDTIIEEPEFTAYLFSFINNENKRVTGQLNIPAGDPPPGGFPIIVMLRGYIDPEGYQAGDGTRNGAAYYASRGYITIAPDFLGYGDSGDPDPDTLAARVKRPATVLSLLNSLTSLPNANPNQVVMWGHSNGGQIALTILEVIGQSAIWQGRNIPTTLWAPVSKPFPYNILYYTDEYSDRGKALRKVLAQFEKDYDVDLYSIHDYYDWITSPIQLHQGALDDSVPLEWSDELNSTLEELEKPITYYTYSGADHNLRPAWSTVVARDIQFFNQSLNQLNQAEE